MPCCAAASSGGTIGCSKVHGTCSPGSLPAGLPVQHLPTFVWNPSNYPAVNNYASGAAFVSAVTKQNSSGTFHITGDVGQKFSELSFGTR